jgi:hypothetical protein
LDDPSSHGTPEFREICPERGIEVLFLVPYPSDYAQSLDLLTFALMKKHFSGSSFSQLKNLRSNWLVRIRPAWTESSAPKENIEVFMKIDVLLYEEPMRYAQYDLKVQRERGSREGEGTSRVR